MFHSCRYCGSKLNGKNPNKKFCSDAHKMRFYRIEKKGFQIVMVERSELSLKKRLVTMRYDGNENDFFIHKKEYGDQLSKDCWLIFLKGNHLKQWISATK